MPTPVQRQIDPLLKSLYVMAAMVEARDPYTGGHLWRVAQFSRLLAVDLGLSSPEVARISLGGFLHDLGKIGVPDAILNKRAVLTDEEHAVIRTHPQIGARLLAGHPLAALVHSAVTQHHETPDGRGYPEGLHGDAIPLDARIIGLTDAFDAMTSTRPYRQGMPIPAALEIIAAHLGSQFDRELGEHLIAMGQRGELAGIVGHSEAGIPVFSCLMCGPTIVVRQAQQHGEHAYCRACGGEAEIIRQGADIRLKPTGRKGGPAELEPDIDEALIDELAAHSSHYLIATPPAAGWMGRMQRVLRNVAAPD